MIDKLPYVYEDLDRHGNVRIYVWRGKGHRKVRIRERPGTPEFRRAYDAALVAAHTETTEVPAKSPSVQAVKPGTLRWLCIRYFRECVDYRRLSARTQHVRRLVLESAFVEPVAPGRKEVFGDFPIDRLTAKAIRVLRDRKVDAPEAGNARIKALRQVFAWAIATEVESITSNPARDAPYFTSTGSGFHTWTREEIAQFEAHFAIGTKARLALALLLYTGVRRSDVVTLGRQMIRGGWIHFVEAKGRRQMEKNRALPILPELQAVIDGTSTGNLTFLVTEFGAPFTANGFGNWFRDRCNEAGLPHCSAHGLRKAGATIAAENGATEHQLMALYGWESPKQAAVYTRQANRKRLSEDAMHLVVPSKK